MEKKIAVYAGSFDPFTNGHLHLFEQAKTLFDDIYVLFALNPKKQRFTVQTDMANLVYEMLNKDLHPVPGMIIKYQVLYTTGLVADFCKQVKATHLIRGLRNTTDYLYEEEIAKANKELYPELETIYFRAKDEVVSSSFVRLLWEQGRNIDKYVPKPVAEMLKGLKK